MMPDGLGKGGSEDQVAMSHEAERAYNADPTAVVFGAVLAITGPYHLIG